jgi:predicted transposase/invertase (TIGR01784 family)
LKSGRRVRIAVHAVRRLLKMVSRTFDARTAIEVLSRPVRRTMTTTPHDALFKAAFSKLRHARGLLRSLVPEPLGRRIAWQTLRVESGIAVGDEDLEEQRMDLVYSVRAGRQRVLIYVLAEHQSTVDPWMAFRLLCYLIAIWKTYRAQHPRAHKLPAILPVVVHHSPTGWTAPVAFEDLLDADAELLDAFGPYLLRFRFLLDDLSAQSDAELRARTRMTGGGRVVILALKHGRDRVAVRIQALSPDGRSPAARDVLVMILRYTLETSQTKPATLRALLARQVGRKEAENMLTTAERLRREGEARGAVKGKRESLLLQLRQRFGPIPAAARARIDEAGAAKLDQWFSRVLTASSLDEVLRARSRRGAPARAREEAAPTARKVARHAPASPR